MILVYALIQALRLSVSPSQGKVIQYWLGRVPSSIAGGEERNEAQTAKQVITRCIIIIECIRGLFAYNEKAQELTGGAISC